MQNNSKQIIASLLEKTLLIASVKLVSRNNTMSAVEISSRSGSSLETVFFWTLMGLMRAAIPMRSKTFMMLLPITLPRRISVLPLISEEKETASSGAPVPNATIVRPIRSLLTLKLDAIDDAPSTSQSAPLMSITKPTMSNKIGSNSSMYLCCLCLYVLII